MEVHVILDCVDLFEDVFGEELGQWGLLLPRLLVKHDDQGADLLQILHLGPNQVLVTLDTHNGYAIVAHVSDDVTHKLSQLVKTG